MPTVGAVADLANLKVEDAFEKTDRGDLVPVLKSRATFAIDLAGGVFSSDDKAKIASAIKTVLGATGIEITSATLTEGSARLRRMESGMLRSTGTVRSLAKSNADVAFVAKFDGVGALKNAQSRIARGAAELASNVPLSRLSTVANTRLCSLVETDRTFDCTRHRACHTGHNPHH